MSLRRPPAHALRLQASVFFVEACIAQPVARCAMQKLHRIRDEACE